MMDFIVIWGLCILGLAVVVLFCIAMLWDEYKPLAKKHMLWAIGISVIIFISLGIYLTIYVIQRN